MTPEQKAGKVDKGEKLDWIVKLNSFKEEKEQEDDDEEDEREREREKEIFCEKNSPPRGIIGSRVLL